MSKPRFTKPYVCPSRSAAFAKVPRPVLLFCRGWELGMRGPPPASISCLFRFGSSTYCCKNCTQLEKGSSPVVTEFLPEMVLNLLYGRFEEPTSWILDVFHNLDCSTGSTLPLSYIILLPSLWHSANLLSKSSSIDEESCDSWICSEGRHSYHSCPFRFLPIWSCRNLLVRAGSCLHTYAIMNID